MSNIQHRLPGEDAAHPDATKENATAGNRGADKANQMESMPIVERSRETTRERGLYPPPLWAELARAVKRAKFRGKSKRQLRAAAIHAKRGDQGAIDFQLIGLIALAAVSGLLLAGDL